MNLEKIKETVNRYASTANFILEGERESYDGADGARYVAELCGYCKELIKELENNDSMIFSQRYELAKETEKWCKDNEVKVCPLGIITALSVMGKLK